MELDTPSQTTTQGTFSPCWFQFRFPAKKKSKEEQPSAVTWKALNPGNSSSVSLWSRVALALSGDSLLGKNQQSGHSCILCSSIPWSLPSHQTVALPWFIKQHGASPALEEGAELGVHITHGHPSICSAWLQEYRKKFQNNAQKTDFV